MTHSTYRIDFRQIAFPSDQLSFGQIRKLFPELSDASPECTSFFSKEARFYHTDNLESVLDCERAIAIAAFSAVHGETWTHPDDMTIKEVKEFIKEEYIRYGIASGKHHAAQLIRGIEAAAVEQANGHSKAR